MYRRHLIAILAAVLLLALGCTNPGPVPKDLELNLSGYDRGLGGMSMSQMSGGSGYPKMKMWSKGMSSGSPQSMGSGSMVMVMVQEVDPKETAQAFWEQVKENPRSLAGPAQPPPGVDYEQEQINIASGNRAYLGKATSTQQGQTMHVAMLVTAKGGYGAVAIGMTPDAQERDRMVDAFRQARAVENPNGG